jgi:hypothetical protein
MGHHGTNAEVVVVILRYYSDIRRKKSKQNHGTTSQNRLSPMGYISKASYAHYYYANEIGFVAVT